MPSRLHEGLISLFQDPNFAASCLQQLGCELPKYTTAKLGPTSLNKPLELRADQVTCLYDAEGKLKGAVIVEIQLKWDRRKLTVWLAYVSNLMVQLGTPKVYLLVVTRNPRVAKLSREGLTEAVAALRPFVIGPETFPTLTDSQQIKKHMERAVLAVVTNPGSKDWEHIRPTVEELLLHIDKELPSFYIELIWEILSDEMRNKMSELINRLRLKNFEFSNPIAVMIREKGEARGEAKGKAEGKAEGLRIALKGLCEVFDIALTQERAQSIETLDLPGLERMWEDIKRTHAWPA